MAQRILFGAAAAVVSVGMLAIGYWAGASADSENTGDPTVVVGGGGELDGQIRDYLMRNPEVLVEAQQALESRRAEEQRLAQAKTLESRSDSIFRLATDGIIGNPDGKVSVVEFYDYNCGFCKRALADMITLTEQNKDLRFVLKEFPILGPDSHAAHVVAEAFKDLMPDQYGEFHNRLLGDSGRATEARAIELAVSLGADEAALREAMKNPTIEARFRETYELADALGITGTPSYVVGDEVVFGAQGAAVIAPKVANLEQCGKTVC
jgi:protein-disulfide isomerase